MDPEPDDDDLGLGEVGLCLLVGGEGLVPLLEAADLVAELVGEVGVQPGLHALFLGEQVGVDAGEGVFGCVGLVVVDRPSRHQGVTEGDDVDRVG